MALIVNCCKQTQTIFGDDDFPMDMSVMTKALNSYKCIVCGSGKDLMMGKHKPQSLSETGEG